MPAVEGVIRAERNHFDRSGCSCCPSVLFQFNLFNSNDLNNSEEMPRQRSNNDRPEKALLILTTIDQFGVYVKMQHVKG